MKVSKKTMRMTLIAVLAGVIVMCGIVYFFHSAFIHKYRIDKPIGISIALTMYANDYEILPPFDKWCDTLIEEADCGPGHFQSIIKPQDGVCGYALNKNLEGLKFSELPDKTVLVFEAIGPWNQSGGPELAKKWNRKRNYIVFVDRSIAFVPIEEIDKLKWKP
jgi:hypothetical protein